MTRLEGISADDLREALDDVDGSRPSRRLIAGLAYEHGVAQAELAEWFGVERKTVYNWLRRLEEGPDDLVDAARDAPRSGRPTKLTAEQLAALESVLADPPDTVGFDAATWTPSILRRFVREEYGVDYSLPSCRRLLARLDGDRRRTSGAMASEETGKNI